MPIGGSNPSDHRLPLDLLLMRSGPVSGQRRTATTRPRNWGRAAAGRSDLLRAARHLPLGAERALLHRAAPLLQPRLRRLDLGGDLVPLGGDGLALRRELVPAAPPPRLLVGRGEAGAARADDGVIVECSARAKQHLATMLRRRVMHADVVIKDVPETKLAVAATFAANGGYAVPFGCAVQ